MVCALADVTSAQQLPVLKEPACAWYHLIEPYEHEIADCPQACNPCLGSLGMLIWLCHSLIIVLRAQIAKQC